MTSRLAGDPLGSLWGLHSQADRQETLEANAAGLAPNYAAAATESLPKKRSFLAESVLMDSSQSLLPKLGTTVGTRHPIDGLALVRLEQSYNDLLPNPFEAMRPSYLYRFLRAENLNGESAGFDLRMIGLYPAGPIEGSVMYLRGVGHGFEYDEGPVREFLRGGFAVFTMDFADHGLSGFMDPRKAGMNSASVYTRHARQLYDEVNRIRTADPRLEGKPLFLMASSLGGRHSVDLLTRLGAGHGFAAIALDGACLTMGQEFDAFRAKLEGLAQLLKVNPAEALARFLHPNISKVRDVIDPAKQDYIQRYIDASMGAPFAPPLVVADGLFHDRDVWTRLQDTREEVQSYMPPLLLGVYEQDPKVDWRRNLVFGAQFGNPETTWVQRTADHNGFVTKDSPLARNTVNFFKNRPLSHPSVRRMDRVVRALRHEERDQLRSRILDPGHIHTLGAGIAAQAGLFPGLMAPAV